MMAKGQVSDMTREEAIGGRIAEAMDAALLKPEDVAVELDVSTRTVRRWLSGGFKGKRGQLASIAEMSNVRHEWLLTGEGPMRAEGGGDGTDSSEGGVNMSSLDDILRKTKGGKDVIDGLVIWRFNPEERAGGAGPGVIQDVGSEGEKLETIIRHKEEVRRLTGYSATSLEPIQVAGDSMKDEIRPNTPALYLPMKRFTVDGIYVISMDGAEIIKRVHQLGGGAVLLQSANDAYPDQLYLPLKEADTPNMYRSDRTGLTCTLRCVGRVVIYTVST